MYIFSFYRADEESLRKMNDRKSCKIYMKIHQLVLVDILGYRFRKL